MQPRRLSSKPAVTPWRLGHSPIATCFFAGDQTPIDDVVMHRITLRGSIVGGRDDLAEAIAFAAEGKLRAEIHKAKLEDVNQIFDDLKGGTVIGRVVIMM